MLVNATDECLNEVFDFSYYPLCNASSLAKLRLCFHYADHFITHRWFFSEEIVPDYPLQTFRI